jgi:hypothetical protein
MSKRRKANVSHETLSFSKYYVIIRVQGNVQTYKRTNVKGLLTLEISFRNESAGEGKHVGSSSHSHGAAFPSVAL